MVGVTEMYFKVVRQAIVELANKYETQQMIMEQLNKIQQEFCIIKANSIGVGPTKVD